MVGIYKITNKQNGMCYIGQTDDLKRRISEHKQKRTETIDDYINVLGVENFDFEIIEECSLQELDQKEKFYIEKFDSKNNGYNIQNGGFNNSQGEGNGRAKLTEQDVIFIRQSYANHVQPTKFYDKYFKNKITKNQFQAIWQGKSWSSIMPEVFTEENKRYYISGQNQMKALLTTEEVLVYRKYYVNHTAQEVYIKFLQEKGDILKKTTFKKILVGDVRNTSVYKQVPIYKKSIKRWELNGEPVSTISESGE